MDSLLALTLFQCIQHWKAVLILCLAQSELQYGQWHLKKNFVDKFNHFLRNFRYILPDDENSSCLQTTCASAESQESSHTVPHTPLIQTSTRPSREEGPPTILTFPFAQAKNVQIMTIIATSQIQYELSGTNQLSLGSVHQHHHCGYSLLCWNRTCGL